VLELQSVERYIPMRPTINLPIEHSSNRYDSYEREKIKNQGGILFRKKISYRTAQLRQRKEKKCRNFLIKKSFYYFFTLFFIFSHFSL